MSDTFIRFHNTIVNYEKLSTRFIDPENYIIINFTFSESIDTQLIEDFISKIAENVKFIFCFIHNCRLIIVFGVEIINLFEGNHQKICSYFTSNFSLFFNKFVICNLVELNSQTKIISYIQHAIFNNPGYFLKYTNNEKKYLKEIPNMKDIEKYKNFFFL